MRNAKVHTEISDVTKSWQICAQFQRSRSLEETQMRLLGSFSQKEYQQETSALKQ